MKTTLCLTFVSLIAPALAAGQQNFTYLALGDSVPFGMNVTLLPPYTNVKPTQSEFIGYPETIANIDRLIGLTTLINAACPGETSGSFVNTAIPDNGCNSSHMDPYFPPFKTENLLHVNYMGSQMDFAVSQLETNKQIKLVTLSIGANDIILALPALEACGTNSMCQQGVLGPVLETYGGYLFQILTELRAHYNGLLILLTYYSPLPTLDTVTQALNSTMTTVAASFHNITLADGYKAFSTLDAPFGDNACTAGLLIKLPPTPPSPTPCDIHPSPLGRVILAATVEFAAFGH